MATTIQLENSTKDKLKALKAYKRESFDDILNKLLYLIPKGDDEGEYTDDFRAGLLEAHYEAKKGEYVTSEKLGKELGFI